MSHYCFNGRIIYLKIWKMWLCFYKQIRNSSSEDIPSCISSFVKFHCSSCGSQLESGLLFPLYREDSYAALSITLHLYSVTYHNPTSPPSAPCLCRIKPHQQRNHASPAIQPGRLAGISLLPLSQRGAVSPKQRGLSSMVKMSEMSSPWGRRCLKIHTVVSLAFKDHMMPALRTFCR